MYRPRRRTKANNYACIEETFPKRKLTRLDRQQSMVGVWAWLRRTPEGRIRSAYLTAPLNHQSAEVMHRIPRAINGRILKERERLAMAYRFFGTLVGSLANIPGHNFWSLPLVLVVEKKKPWLTYVKDADLGNFITPPIRGKHE